MTEGLSTAPVKVLIIDDDQNFAESNKDLLEAFDYQVEFALNGSDGVAKAKIFLPDVVLLDVMMTTDVEGYDVARKLHALPGLEKTAILLVTGVTKALDLMNAPIGDPDWLPVDRVLEKPISPNALLSEIERVLAKKRTGGGAPA